MFVLNINGLKKKMIYSKAELQREGGKDRTKSSLHLFIHIKATMAEVGPVQSLEPFILSFIWEFYSYHLSEV